MRKRNIFFISASIIGIGCQSTESLAAAQIAKTADVIMRMEAGNGGDGSTTPSYYGDSLTAAILNDATYGNSGSSHGTWRLLEGQGASVYPPVYSTVLTHFKVSASHENSLEGFAAAGDSGLGDSGSSRSFVYYNYAPITISGNVVHNRQYAQFDNIDKPKVALGCFVTFGNFPSTYGSYDIIAMEGSGEFVVLNFQRGSGCAGTGALLQVHTQFGAPSGWNDCENTIQVELNRPYWIAMLWERDGIPTGVPENVYPTKGRSGRATVEVYDAASWALIGRSVLALQTTKVFWDPSDPPNSPKECQTINIGRTDLHAYNVDAYHWFDDLVIDLTGNRFPLLPSEATIQNYQFSHSLNDEFTLSGNPVSNGRWSYGWKQTLGGGFTALGVQYNGSSGDGGVTIPSWQFSTTQEPVAYWNSTPNTVTVGGGWLSFPSHCVWFYPGQDYEDQNYGVIRYTVPSGESGIYQIIGEVDAVYKDLGIGDTDFSILKNGTPIYSRDIEEAGDALFTKTTTLSAGDTVEFAIGRGADGSTYASGLKIFADICKVANSGGTYSQSDLNESFGTGSSQGGDWRYGWKETLAGSFTQLTVQHNGSLDDEWNVIPSWQLTSGLEPAVYRNQQSHTVTIGSGLSFLNPHAIWFCAGQDSRNENYGVIRYTVPSGQSGTYQLGVSVQSLYDIFNGGDADFHVLVNGVEVAGQNIQAGGSALHTQTLVLTAGDTVDFAVGRGYEDPLYGSILKIFGEVSRIQ